MSCCGSGRRSLRGRSPSPSPAAPALPLAGSTTRVFFEYAGRTSLLVIGPVSGRRYRFTRPGVRLEADLRDRPSLAAVPHLREIRV